MGKDCAGQAHCRARLEVAPPFVGAAGVIGATSHTMVRIVSFGQVISYARTPFHSKGLPCPSLRRPSSPMPSTMRRRSAARACSCSACSTCSPCLVPPFWFPCLPVFPFRQRFCLLAWARCFFTSCRVARYRPSWARRLPSSRAMRRLHPTARRSFYLTPAWVLPAPACSIRCWRRCSAHLVPSASCASFRRW